MTAIQKAPIRLQGMSGSSRPTAKVTRLTHTGHCNRADCERISQIARGSPHQLKRQDLSGEQPQ